jgi:hypothetical protein
VYLFRLQGILDEKGSTVVHVLREIHIFTMQGIFVIYIITHLIAENASIVAVISQIAYQPYLRRALLFLFVL